jgi:hypothetical protein
MKSNKAPARLSVVGKLPEGYIVLCELDGGEHSFLAKSLGISVECPHCGTTRCGAELAQEYFLGRSAAASGSPFGIMAQAHHIGARGSAFSPQDCD